MHKVLLVDDEPDIQDIIKQFLSEQYEVLIASNGEEGIFLARSQQPDLILLDIAMPKLDGIAVCENLRSNEATKHIPIIMLTAATDLNQRVQSFLTGADDYISKPYSPKELVARIHSKLRRVQESKKTEEELECGNLTLNPHKMEVTIAGKAILLSVLEFNLLKYFIENKDRLLSRKHILEAVWRDSIVSARTVDTHIVSLRKKLIDFNHSISTLYGAGYILRTT